jgi:hypothetical protein
VSPSLAFRGKSTGMNPTVCGAGSTSAHFPNLLSHTTDEFAEAWGFGAKRDLARRIRSSSSVGFLLGEHKTQGSSQHGSSWGRLLAM